MEGTGKRPLTSPFVNRGKTTFGPLYRKQKRQNASTSGVKDGDRAFLHSLKWRRGVPRVKSHCFSQNDKRYGSAKRFKNQNREKKRGGERGHQSTTENDLFHRSLHSKRSQGRKRVGREGRG